MVQYYEEQRLDSQIGKACVHTPASKQQETLQQWTLSCGQAPVPLKEVFSLEELGRPNSSRKFVVALRGSVGPAVTLKLTAVNCIGSFDGESRGT